MNVNDRCWMMLVNGAYQSYQSQVQTSSKCIESRDMKTPFFRMKIAASQVTCVVIFHFDKIGFIIFYLHHCSPPVCGCCGIAHKSRSQTSIIIYGCFHKWGYPKWMVYNGKKPTNMDDLGVPLVI